jgi:hypothetical protein
MAWTIANCIVTRKFVVVTYSGVPAPDFKSSGAPIGSFSLSLAGAANPQDLSSPGASITFYPSIPSTIITNLPSPKPTRGSTFTLTVTDEAGYQSAPYDGVVSEGEPEAVGLLFNQMMESLNPTGPINQVGSAVGAAATAVTGAISGPGNNSVVGAINNAAGAVAGAFNAPTFPILTEDVSYSQPSLGTPRGSSGMSGGGGSIGQVATQAISAVLGWKLNNDAPAAFVGALTQSFTLTEVEGHVQSTWVPRSYAVQTDLSGGITGAQASIYTRAKEALDQSLPLLNGLYALDPIADPEDVTAYRDVVTTQLTQLVDEFGFLGGPRVPRVNTYFSLLLGQAFPLPAAAMQTDSDQINGSLGQLRQLYGIYTLRYPGAISNPFINSVGDEENTTNFRVLSDYITSLALSWINNLPFFGLNTLTPFFGTQLVLLSRQLSVVSEDVDEVRFTMDSVYIGPSERQTLQVNFGNDANGNPVVLFFEDFAKWVQGFVADEAPPLIQDGGIYAVRFTFLPVAQQLYAMANGCLDPNAANLGLPAGFHTGRVQQALAQLADDLNELVQLAQNIK